MEIQRKLRSLVVAIFLANSITPTSAFAYPQYLYTPTINAPLGSVITVFGQDMSNANMFTIRPTSPPPNFSLSYSIPAADKISDTEIRLTLPTFEMLEPYLNYDFGFGLTSVTPDRTYTINIYDNTSTSEIFTIELYRPDPYSDGNGKVTCSENGYVTISSGVLTSNNSCRGTLTLPSGVTQIGNDVFYFDTYLTQIIFPPTLTRIGVQAFTAASGLSSISFPSNLETIGNSAFAGTNITSVNIPNSVTTIGNSAFENTTNLTNVTFGNRVTNIGQKAFKNTALTNISIPASITAIGNEAFKDIDTLQSIEFCWPDGIDPTVILNGLEYVDLICNQRTTITVTSLLDSGPGSLADAITQIAASDVQDSFLVVLPAGTINVADGFTEITRDTEIRGQGESSILNLTGLGTDVTKNVLFKTNRTSVDLVLKNIVVQGTITSGSVIRNNQGFVQVLSSKFKNISNNGSDGLIENYADINLRLYSTITIQDSVFQNITGSKIFYSDYGYAPSTSLSDLDYNNKIYNSGSIFDNVANIAEVQRFLKFDNSTFKNLVSASISTGNNRFQLLNSTFESNISLNISTAWDPLTGYDTRSGVNTSLTALEKVVSGNTFKNVSTLSPFITLDTGAEGVGLATITNNDFQFISNTSPKSPELSDLLFDATLYTAETVFTGNRYFYPSTLSFNGNQSSGGSMSNSIGVGTGTLPSNQFTRSGFSFYGWNTQADGLGSSFTNQAAYTYGVDQTLFAIWTKNPIASDSNTQADARLLEEKAKQARELQQLLTVLPSIGNLAVEIGKLIENLTTQKCVKGKKIKKIKAGAKCPKGYKARK